MSSLSTPERHAPSDAGSGLELAWALLLALRGLRRDAGFPATDSGLWLSAEDKLRAAGPDDPRAQLIWRHDRALGLGPRLPLQAQPLVDLYSPLFSGRSGWRPVVIGHLGQSVDAQIATESGDSCYVTGRENLIHMHRMRALCDAVVVGAGTVDADDPQLTTRLVDGPHPVRVVIDPQRRLPADRRVFTDGKTTTLIACAQDRLDETNENASFIGIPETAEGLSLVDLVAALQRRGLRSLFVEGGGITITRWMQAGLLDHLQIATAPVLIGAGRPGLRLPPAPNMNACLRPAYRLFQMGEDLLWDFDLHAKREAPRGNGRYGQAPLRLL